MDEAQAGDRLFGPGSGRRLQATDAIGRLRRVAAGADRLGAVYAAGAGGGVGRARDKDPSEGRVGVRSRRGLELQKKTTLPEEQTRPDVARKRARWKAHQGRIAPSRLVFIDETWIKTNMAPLRGWGPRGKRLKAYAPYGHWKTLTFIAALRHDRIDAPWVLDGPINGELFLLYVERILAPTLSPGDVVVLDNLGSHKGKAARAAVGAQGAHLLFLPPYSPDLKSHRADVRQTQTLDAEVPAPRRRSDMEKGRTTHRPLQPKRVRKIPRQLRIRFRLKESCSNYRKITSASPLQCEI